ncbi:phage holin [Clostridium saccharoperbutylacetonicum]|uniref:phage holin n=1 Tax=Clostridium saccharoperbutylacetonicum TaxID=36745 RepID=UPI0039E7BA3E
MLTLNLKARFRNKLFVISFVGAIVLLLQQLGLKQYIPENWSDVLNSILSILVMLGIITDTSTPGISDKIDSPNEQGINNYFISDSTGTNATDENTKAESQDNTIQVAIKDDSTNSDVQANTASSKIVVDVPQE